MNIDYLSKCIEETQNAIMQLEDDHINTTQLFNDMDQDEVLYIMDKLANSAINYAILSSQREDELKESDSKVKALLNENMYRTNMLNYMVSKNFVCIILIDVFCTKKIELFNSLFLPKMIKLGYISSFI